MTKKDNNKTDVNPIFSWVKGYIYLTATAFALVGFFLLHTWWVTQNSGDLWLGGRDALLGISNRSMLILGGLLHLGVAAYLFAARDLLGRAVAILWAGLNDVIYYAGVHLIAPLALSNTERFIGWRLQLQPAVVDSRWRIFQLCLIATSIVALILIWQQSWHHSRQINEQMWFKQWQKTREQEYCVAKPVVQDPQPVPGNYLKISCPHCSKHIEFPAHAFGQNIPCPHCAKTITLINTA